jgi:hypothetical protein
MFSAAAMLGWVGVGAYGIWAMAREEAGDGWERPFQMFAVSLFLAVGSTIAATWLYLRLTQNLTLGTVGAGLGAITVASSVVAWALPLWATLLAISCTLPVVAAPHRIRPGLAVLAGAQFVGMAAMFAAIAAEVGRQDSYGDYPVAFGLGNTTIAAGSVLGLAMLAREGRSPRREPAITPSHDAPAHV